VVKIEIGKTKILFPEKWEELTPEDFSRVGHVLLNQWTPALQYMIIRLLTPKVHPSVWVNLDDDELLALMMTALDVQKCSERWTKDSGQYIPNPATWLNQGRWMDENGETHQPSLLSGGI